MSIYQRLFLWFCTANLITLAVSVLIAHAIFERNADRAPDIEPLVEQVQAALDRGQRPKLESLRGGRRAVLVQQGRVLGDRPVPRHIQRHLEEMTEASGELRLPRGIWLVSRRLQPEVSQTYLVMMALPSRPPPWQRSIAPAVQILLSVLAIAGVGWVVANHLTQPLQQIQNALRRVTGGDLSTRVTPAVSTRADEYGDVARDFDRMATQIQTLVQSRDQLLHDVSHELRAPLSRLRFALELARTDRAPENLARADREIERMDRLVGELLALARMEHTSDAMLLPDIDLVALAEDVIDAEQPQAAHAGVNLVLKAKPVHAPADREALLRALENLVRNAMRFAPAGSEIVIEVGVKGGNAQIRVLDRGPGVAEEERLRLFEPFFRGKAATSGEGHGLGLAIVSRVMRTHQGRAEARNREGGGLEVMLEWPTRIVRNPEEVRLGA